MSARSLPGSPAPTASMRASTDSSTAAPDSRPAQSGTSTAPSPGWRRGRADADLVDARYGLEYGNHVALRGVPLLHIAAGYNELAAADLLLRHGADLNANAEMGRNGVGGQTPLFHAIGSNQGGAFPTFKFLMDRGPDLSATADLQTEYFCEDPVHKGQDHSFVLARTPRADGRSAAWDAYHLAVTVTDVFVR